ncbi:MAG: hypothetical protein AAB801_00730 [Patescibacteria group bacterium]
MAKKSSRLRKKLERKSRRNVLLSLLGISILGIFLLKLGIPFLSDVSYRIGSLFQTQSNEQSLSDEFVSTPILNPLPEATNSAEVNISGSSLSGYEVLLYINGELDDREKVRNNEFSFEKSLTEGENIIKLKASFKDRESEFTDPVVINIKTAPPLLEIETPTDGQEVSKKSLEVKGKTDMGARITVNGYWALMEGENFSYTLELNDGDNEIKVEAVDEAGNKTERKIKVKYSP